MSIFSKISGNNKLPFGLDIGYTSVRAVELQKKGKLVHLTSYGETPLKEGVFSRDNINVDELSFAIKKVLSGGNIGEIKSRQVICALPEEDIFIKNLQLPTMEDDELTEVIKFELEKIVPIPINDLYLDYRRVKMADNNGKDNIIVAAARKKIIHMYMDALKKADLEVIALDIEPAAVARALIPKEETDKNAYLILDMGAESTTITVYDFGSIQITGSTRVAGNSLTEGISKNLKINVKDAEDIKRHVINADRKLKKPLFDSAIKPVLTKLAKEIERSIGYYTNYMKSPHDIKKIIITGGNAHFPEMTKFLEDYFRIKTEVGNPWANVTAYPLKAMPKLKASLYTTAIGLALRELVEK